VVSSIALCQPASAVGGARHPDSTTGLFSGKTAGGRETPPTAGLSTSLSHRSENKRMRIFRNVLLIGVLAAVGAVPVIGQVHK
jgi:hypothetical protein